MKSVFAVAGSLFFVIINRGETLITKKACLGLLQHLLQRFIIRARLRLSEGLDGTRSLGIFIKIELYRKRTFSNVPSLFY